MNLDADKVAALWEEYQRTRTVEVRNRLVEQFMPLVRKIAKNMQPKLVSFVEQEELAQYGVFGLLDSIADFDPSRGFSFKTFAYRRIVGAIIDGLRGYSQIPRVTTTRAKKIDAVIQHHQVTKGRRPADEEIQNGLGLDDAEYHHWTVNDRLRKTVNLMIVKTHSDGKKEVIEQAHSEDTGFAKAEAKLDAGQVMGLLLDPDGMFSLTQALLMKMYYLDGMPMSEIADCFTLSESRVSQIHAKLLRQINSQFQRRKGNFPPSVHLPTSQSRPQPEADVEDRPVCLRHKRYRRSLELQSKMSGIIPQMLEDGCRVTDALLMHMYYVELRSHEEICEALKYRTLRAMKKRRQVISDRLHLAGRI